jgi:hypothetical protein
MATVEHQADEHAPVADSWTSEFFSEEHIVHTMQHLLYGSTHSIDDLCRLCVAASQDHVVLALNLQGMIEGAGEDIYITHLFGSVLLFWYHISVEQVLKFRYLSEVRNYGVQNLGFSLQDV